VIRKVFTGTFDEYMKHQAEKTCDPSTVEKINRHRAGRVEWFRNRFCEIQRGNALCLGARYGEEVEALRSLGFVARGIDLVERPPLVNYGDMNDPIPQAYSLIYTNAFDHCWEPEQFLKNIHGGLRDEGLFVLHFRGDGQAGRFETIAWEFPIDVYDFVWDNGFKVIEFNRFPEFFGLTHECIAEKSVR
jgi:SAM-dependent methyltransferase